MFLKYIAASLLALATFVDASGCASVAVRKEIRDLSSDELSAFLAAMRGVGQASSPNIYDKLSAIHVTNQLTIHGYPIFLVWHRVFIRYLEDAMIEYDPSVALHYWDWTKDAKHPENSAIMQDTMFGGSTDGQCINTESFPHWTAMVPSQHCVTRQFAEGTSPGPFYPRAITDEIKQQSDTYDYYRVRIEGGPHAAPHNGVGGDLSSMQSPEDPLFYIHHSFLDKLFTEWQYIDWENRQNAYDGTNCDLSSASTSDALTDLGFSVGDALDIENMCYTYQDTGAPNDYGTVNDLPMLLATPPNATSASQSTGSFGVATSDNGPSAGGDNSPSSADNGASSGFVGNAADDSPSGASGFIGNAADAVGSDNDASGPNNLVRRNYWPRYHHHHHHKWWWERRHKHRPRIWDSMWRKRLQYREPNYEWLKRHRRKVPVKPHITKPFDHRIPMERIKHHAANCDEEMVYPRPIDEKWLIMNNLDVETQRFHEGAYGKVIDQVNGVIRGNRQNN